MHCIINPLRMRKRVSVVDLCVCVSVCVFYHSSCFTVEFICPNQSALRPTFLPENWKLYSRCGFAQCYAMLRKNLITHAACLRARG